MLTDAFAGCAAGINERGQIVGWNFVQSTNAVLWQDGTSADLGALPGDDLSIATAINNREQIVGYSLGGVTWHAVIWDHGTISDLGTLTGPAGCGGLSLASDINDRGQVVGGCSDEVLLGHGFLWEDGAMTDLGTLIGPAGSSRAAGINNRGQIVGKSDSVAGSHTRSSGSRGPSLIWAL